MKSIIYLLILLICPWHLAYGVDYLPQDFISHYKLYRDDTKVGEMTRIFRHHNNGYSLVSESRTTGLISVFYKDNMMEKTTWTMQGQKFIPLEYEYHRDRKKKKRSVKINFDHDKGLIKTDVNGSSWEMPIKGEVFDKLLYQLAIMAKLNHQERIEAFTVADGGKTKIYSFTNLGNEVIETPLGKLHATKLSRQKSGKNEKLTLWFAKEYGYLPVKVESISEDDVRITALIDSYSNNLQEFDTSSSNSMGGR